MKIKHSAAIAGALTVLLLTTTAAIETAQYKYPFQNPNVPIEDASENKQRRCSILSLEAAIPALLMDSTARLDYATWTF